MRNIILVEATRLFAEQKRPILHLHINEQTYVNKNNA